MSRVVGTVPRRRPRASRPAQGGFILIFVVVLVAALTLILMQVNQLRGGLPQQAEREIARAVQGREGRALLDFVLAASVANRSLEVDSRYLAFRRLLQQDPARLAELEDAVEQLKAMLEQVGFEIQGRGTAAAGGAEQAIGHDGVGQLFSPGKKTYTLALGERSYRVRLLPGNALPNLNGLPFEPMARYLEHLGLPTGEARQLAADIIDWRDADAFRTEQIGAEQEYYLSLERPYAPRNAAFTSWGELAYLRGVTPERLRLLRDNLMLGAADSPTVLADHLEAEALAKLAGVKTPVLQAVLKEFSSGGSTADISALVSADEAAAVDRVLAWNPDHERVRVVVEGLDLTVAADYDLKAKRLVGRW